jgi:hypothetical protein
MQQCSSFANQLLNSRGNQCAQGFKPKGSMHTSRIVCCCAAEQQVCAQTAVCDPRGRLSAQYVGSKQYHAITLPSADHAATHILHTYYTQMYTGWHKLLALSGDCTHTEPRPQYCPNPIRVGHRLQSVGMRKEEPSHSDGKEYCATSQICNAGPA